MRFLLLIIFCCYLLAGRAQNNDGHSFKLVPLGVKGGIDEGNLSSYMLAPAGSNAYICLDAGTLYHGIEKAAQAGVFTVPASLVLKDSVRAYLISHPHLDHLSGLVINSPDDGPKKIYALPYTIAVLKEKYFNWKAWANFANEGDLPALNKYSYSPLAIGRETIIENTDMAVTAYPLSHTATSRSTAFLIRSGDSYLLYLGDTGADKIENSANLANLWQNIAPLIRQKKLKGICIEVSYPDEQPDKNLFGHLKPVLFMEEMKELSQLCGPSDLKGFNVVIVHIKPSLDNEEQIKSQLSGQNSLELNLIFPEQGKPLMF